ncbi:MAG: hypothetical protein WD360_02720 [Nitriliruptoraceae bacterium]
MTQALLLIFLVWAVLLVPLGVRRRQEHPQRTVNGFERAMDVLAGDHDSVVGHEQQHVARRVSALKQRRLQLFSTAVRSVAVAGVAALIFGGWMWLLFAATIGLTVGYAAVLRQAKRQRDHAGIVVRELQTYRGDAGGPVAAKGSAQESRTVRLRSYRAQ